MAIEINTNNPLGLTTAGPGYSTDHWYPGQTGSQTSGAGYTFAQFPDMKTGFGAGVDYITRKINSGAVSTAGELVNLFSPNDMSAFSKVTGLSANSPVSAGNASTYAQGIAAGEGTLKSLGSFLTSPQSGIASIFGDSLNGFLNPQQAINGMQQNSNSSPFGSFFTLSTGERILAVVAGLLLLVIALIALVSKTQVGQTIIETGKKAGSAIVA